MRRRRHVLQVSTFPFLAVLLCAMGALVLLLFIMDRRAKIVARNRAQPVEQEVSPVEPVVKFVKHDDSRERSELTRWMGDTQRMRQVLADLEKRIALGRIELKKLKTNLEQRKIALQHDSKKLQHVQTDAKTAYQRNMKLAKQVAEELEDLTEIQEIVRKLANKKSGQKETYSIVPYFGKRGDRRRPIYIEVVGDSAIVHPKRTSITVIPATFTQLRNALHEQIREQTGTEKPYLLFLVRPSGISAYYRAMQVIRSLKIEFGYELIDGDWKLDLTPQATAAAIAATGEYGVGTLGSGMGHIPGSGSLRPGGNAKHGDGQTPKPWNNGKNGTHTPGGMFAKGGIQNGPRSLGGTIAKDGRLNGKTAKNNDTTVKENNDKTGKKSNGASKKTTNSEGNSGNNGKSGKSGKRGKRGSSFERFIGNRNFVITVDCGKDGVVVYPGGRRFDADSFLVPNAEKHPICNEVRKLINRRQATLGGGGSRYRPSIRFRVQPEGRRSYFFAYPVLGTLGLPMVQTRVK